MQRFTREYCHKSKHRLYQVLDMKMADGKLEENDSLNNENMSTKFIEVLSLNVILDVGNK